MAELLPSGSILNQTYRIIDRLGVGGYGAVYLAQHIKLHSNYAVKELFDVSDESKAQFLFEAQILAMLNHKNLPKVSDFFEQEGKPYLVMEYINGQTLETILDKGSEDRRRPLPLFEAINMILQVCNAIEYLHKHKPKPIIHRDIKPKNIIRSQNGRIVLVDFGIAKAYGTKTRDAAKACTSGFSPPEQHTGHTDKCSDIYSVAATLYNLITGRVPPDALSLHMGFTAIAPPSRFNPDVSEDLDKIIVVKGMALESKNRYDSIEQFMQELGDFLLRKPQPVHCSKCGHVQRQRSKFCSYCGTRIIVDTSPTITKPTTLPPEAHLDLGHIYMNYSAYSEALNAYCTAIKGCHSDPEGTKLLYPLALCYAALAHVELDSKEEALRYLEAAVELDPNNPFILQKMGYASLKSADAEKAIEPLEKCVELDSTDHYSYYLLGMACLLSREYGKALSALGKADQNDAHIHAAIGWCYASQMKKTEAINSAKRALDIDPENDQAKEVLRMCEYDKQQGV